MKKESIRTEDTPMPMARLHACYRDKEKGFSLIELSIVLLIIGMLLSVGITVMNSFTQKGKMAREKASLSAIKNSLISYGLSHGKLPCPDTNGDGKGNCPPSSCSSPPCSLPYIDIKLSSVSKDSFSLPYSYDVADILTTTNHSNFCLTVFQLENYHDWFGAPANSACGGNNLPCVTNTSDPDDGNISSAGSGYYLAAYVKSNGEDLAGGGKNQNDTRREYEMSSNPYDTTVNRDDLVVEIGFPEIFSQGCTAANTTMEVTITNGEAWLDNSGGCLPGSGFTSKVNVSMGQTIYYKTGCTASDSFLELTRCNVSPSIYAGSSSCVSGSGFDGRLSINAASSPAEISQ